MKDSNYNHQQSQFSSEQEILLPKCNLNPANQIITKSYEPDQTPIIKLIPKQLLRQKQQKFQHHKASGDKIVSPQISEYAGLFGYNDFLGNYYSDKFDQMIYFKFNNKDYNQLKLNDKKCRFFAGFFVEKQHFQEAALLKFDNIMKSFPYLDFTDYNSNILQSFGKNTKGSSQDPKFSSNYQSANLFAVIKKCNFQYDLILQNDMNSKGNTQWFNFLVNFTQQGNYKFNIVNFTKSHSLYEDGMRISGYSFLKQSYRGNTQNQKTGAGWHKVGKNIKYFRNGIQRQTLGCTESYFTLSFEYNCKHRGESMIFSHSVPYSSLELQKYFHKMTHRRVINHLKMQKLFVCNSVAGQPINCYVITHRKQRSNSMKFKNTFINNSQIGQNMNIERRNTVLSGAKFFQKKTTNTQGFQQISQLKSIIILSRQHSGETQSSFVLEGIIDFLMAPTQLDPIKKNYVFFVFPMINIDGVKYGHYRTNLCGYDLNRVWRRPRRDIHPQIYYTKKFMFQINKNYPISLILDIHGHSKSLNSFFYGNPSKKQNLNFDDPKIFPFICSKRIKQVSYKQSTFNIKQQKKNSARVVLSEMFPKALVYTLQNSFYGFVNNNSKENIQQTQPEVVQFTPQGYRRVGRDIMSTYLQYTRLCEKNTTIKAKWMKQMETIYAQLQKSRTLQNAEDDGGSDSQIQNELIQFEQKPTQQKSKDVSLNLLTSAGKTDKSGSNLLYYKRNHIIRRTQKKKTMPLPKTICQQNVRGISSQNYRPVNTSKDLPIKTQEKENIFKNNTINGGQQNSNLYYKAQYPQAVLSIFKIQTQSSALLRKKPSIKNLLNYKQLNVSKKWQKAQNKSNYGSPIKLIDKDEGQFTIHQKKGNKQEDRKNMNIEEVMNKCQGMKTFLKAMGITIENRKS